MATYGMPSNKLATCPYDPSHRVKESRFQLHITKCRANHVQEVKDVCPFNAQHRMERGMLQHHLMSCADRAPLDKKLVASEDNDSTFRGHVGVPAYNTPPAEGTEFRGHIGVPAYNTPPAEITECWDSELSSRPLAGYKPSVEPPNGGIRTDFGLMKKSDRKKYYKNMHGGGQQNNEEEEERESEKVFNHSDFPQLRPPKTLSRAQMINQPRPFHETQGIVGLGRGQSAGSTSSSRIAANIFGNQDAAFVGMGRGDGVCDNNGHPELATQINDADGLGFGRGIKR